MNVIAYIRREHDEYTLCILDDRQGTLHTYSIDQRGLARLAAESARAVNSSIGGYDATPNT